jgi:hypothetical protein
MPFLIGSSLSRGHERSSPDATVSTFHSLSKFPLLPCGAIAFVAGVALGVTIVHKATMTNRPARKQARLRSG